MLVALHHLAIQPDVSMHQRVPLQGVHTKLAVLGALHHLSVQLNVYLQLAHHKVVDHRRQHVLAQGVHHAHALHRRNDLRVGSTGSARGCRSRHYVGCKGVYRTHALHRSDDLMAGSTWGARG